MERDLSFVSFTHILHTHNEVTPHSDTYLSPLHPPPSPPPNFSHSQDTEFPGVVSKFNPTDFRTQSEFQYKALSSNVNVLKLIQLGVSLFDAKGNVPSGGCCSWQFNFKFNLKSELYSQESIDLLTRSGIQFARHESVRYSCHVCSV